MELLDRLEPLSKKKNRLATRICRIWAQLALTMETMKFRSHFPTLSLRKSRSKGRSANLKSRNAKNKAIKLILISSLTVISQLFNSMRGINVRNERSGFMAKILLRYFCVSDTFFWGGKGKKFPIFRISSQLIAKINCGIHAPILRCFRWLLLLLPTRRKRYLPMMAAFTEVRRRFLF